MPDPVRPEDCLRSLAAEALLCAPHRPLFPESLGLMAVANAFVMLGLLPEPRAEAVLADHKSALEREGFGLFHASPRDPIWEYVLSIDQAEAGLDVAEQRISLIGHSHISLFFTRHEGGPRRTYAHGAQAGDGALLDIDDGGWLINPGSVGQPRDGDARAAWLELDVAEWTARFHRVPYDIDAAAASILAAGLPNSLAERLQVGR